MHHIIRQHHLHVEVNGSESDGLAMQRRLPDLCRVWLMPALERTLDRHAPMEGTLCIERLEIDAGAISLDCLEHDLAESVSQALEKALREQIPSNEYVTEEYGSGNVSHKTPQHSIEEALFFFLETGQLPWSFRLPEGRNLEQAVLDIWEKAGQSGSGIQGTADTLRRVLRTESVRKRLTRQFTTKFLTTLLTRLAPADVAAIDNVFQVLNSSNLKPEERRPLERLLWENTLTRLAALQPVTAEAIVRDVLPTVSAKHRAAVEVLARHWVSDAESRRQPETEAPADDQDRSGKVLQPSNPPEISGHPPAQEEDTPASSSKQISAGQELADTIAEGIYINNAGLVLLHPFLPQFFGALGLAAEDKLLQPERALCLLHFLATGQRIAPEYELMLPKVLCNIPLDMPVEANVDLTGEEQDEADALLKAVVDHWQALRNTSPDGLRGTFLTRFGKISLRGEDLLLQVEPQTWDILLEQLPWGISMIRLPWMERMLWVEWA